MNNNAVNHLLCLVIKIRVYLVQQDLPKFIMVAIFRLSGGAEITEFRLIYTVMKHF